ncbi:MAG: TauD/TfdA family dioxygenase [Alphaproteobacteria bacterium]|nr:TauD/TfdA family dioxygenase [Alphaproteobacteria bacterium]
MDLKLNPRPLETHIDWHHDDVADESQWTVELTDSDKRELDHALTVAKSHSDNLLDIGLAQFPIEGPLKEKIAKIEADLIDGPRGFVRIRTLDTKKYSDDDLTMLYWGIGIHLGDPWPQNHFGHVMGDVTDQGKALTDPTLRGNEIGQVGLDYHTDGADIIGLMCLRKAKSGGLSCVANVVAIYNELVATRPELIAALYQPLPYDARQEQAKGQKPYYMFPVFTEHDNRLFTRFIPQYVLASQKHEDAPRLSDNAREALKVVSEMARDPRYNVYMDLAPGEMQFINNYHVLHGRQEYQDDVANGYKRHLKRLWLSTRYLKTRPDHFRRREHSHWAQNISVSKIKAVDKH